MGRSPQ